MTYDDVMIDLETLALSPDAVVLSIGAVPFNLETGEVAVTDGYYHAIDINSNLDMGRRIDGDTVAWWMGQSDAARSVFKEERVPLDQAMQGLDDFINSHGQPRVWSNGADFDIAILNHVYTQLGVRPPWNFKNTRCVRTYGKLPGADRVKTALTGTAHHALADAYNQALWVCAIHKALFKGK